MRVLPLTNNFNRITNVNENNARTITLKDEPQINFGAKLPSGAAKSGSKINNFFGKIFTPVSNGIKWVQEQYGKWILKSEKVHNFSKWVYSKDTTNATKHFAVIGSLVTSSAYAYKTLHSKSLEKKNSTTLAVNQSLNFLVPTLLGYTLDSLIAGHTKEVEYKFAAKLQRALACSHLSSEEYDKALVRATKQIKGVRTLASIATFTLLYRYLAPVAITPLANRIGEMIGKKKDEKAELEAKAVTVKVS